MLKKLFLSTTAVVLFSLLLSVFSVNLVFNQEFSKYLSQTVESFLSELPARLSTLYQTKGGWDRTALNQMSKTLPLGTEVTLLDSQNQTVAVLTNPDTDMMSNPGFMMSMGHSLGSWKSKTIEISTPQGIVGSARIVYPAAPRILNPQDQAFQSAILRSLMLAGALALILGIILNYLITRRLVRPLKHLTKAADRIGQGRFEERVPVSGKDEVGSLAQAFNSMADRLTHQEKLRKQFTADIAHELRTPLTSIRSYIEAFQDGVLPPDEHNLTILNEEIERLVGLATDLKDLNISEMGGLQLHLSPINLGKLLEKVAYNLSPLIKEKELTLAWGLPSAPVQLEGDERLLTRLFYNILHNAYKYSPEQSEIRITLERETDGVNVQIRDHGSGIDPEDLPYIFERFYRADKSRSRASGGSGIGLALVKQITNLHQGSVTASSTPGSETVFTVKLPFTQKNHTEKTGHPKKWTK
ncbi:sensor histidine kinase [Paradesulfitobacterium ferrireducens]|uniref:sensor histidine kinase n=1 Tax=Paradesulfitobacterium ferrireducens TaxID=2816476 RepID=UPI001A903690|nr:ATP-binding protein [Paradesulfitobacterium ferrireducens]